MIPSMKNQAQQSMRTLQKSAALGSALALIAVLALHPAGAFAAESKNQVSHTIGKEMTAAQKALQAQQWAEAIKNLDEAAQKSGLTAFDKFTIENFKGYAEIKLGKYKEAETDWEAALASGLYGPEEKEKTISALF